MNAQKYIFPQMKGITARVLRVTHRWYRRDEGNAEG